MPNIVLFLKRKLLGRTRNTGTAGQSLKLPWNHRIMESFRLGKTIKIIKSNYHPALPSLPINHVPKHHIYRSFKYF